MLFELKDLLNETINVATPSTRGNDGSITYNAAASRSAYVERKDGEVMSVTGEMLKASHWIVVEASVGMSDRIWLPGDDETDATLARRPLSVEAFTDDEGTTHHYEVML